MQTDRPDPDALLARVQAEENKSHRGHLKVFLGYAAGVGKTFAMLKAAQREKEQGTDVVVGYVEPHGRVETEALLDGLEVLPYLNVEYRGVTLREFDLDKAIARKPKLLLVDELAHSNAEGLRHKKRWQDVEELLDAGIDVYTTVNVQHVESLNDVIAKITGVVVNETLPDAVLERTDEIELIDVTPDELCTRLTQGKIYFPAQAEKALHSFFQKSNLVALRELSLRQAANRLHRDVDAARQQKSAHAPWATNERLLVCVGPSSNTSRLIRSTKRMSIAFNCDWLAVTVTGPAVGTQSVATRDQLVSNLRLAERLGAENHCLVGDDVVDTILEFARNRNVTKIIIGKATKRWWHRIARDRIVDRLLELSGEIDIYVIRGEDGEDHGSKFSRRGDWIAKERMNWKPYQGSLLVIGICGLVGWFCSILGMDSPNIAMIFLLGVAFTATWFGKGPAITASVTGVLVFDFFFIEPRLSFAVSDVQYLITFGVMLVIGLLISALTARVQQQLQLSKKQERRTSSLFRLTRQLSEARGIDSMIQSAGRQLSDLFSAEVAIYLKSKEGIEILFGKDTNIVGSEVNSIVAQWVIEHGQIAGAKTDTLPNASAFFVPMIGSQGTGGAIAVCLDDLAPLQDPEQRLLLETCATLIAFAIEREKNMDR